MSKHVIPFNSKSDDYLKIQKQLRIDGLTMKGNPVTHAKKIKLLQRQMVEPQAICGFSLQIMQRENYDDPGISDILDTRAVVSLAYMREMETFNIDEPGLKISSSSDKTNFLELYLTKLPILCINRLRLQYTIDAFVFLNKVNLKASVRALEFYLKTDIDESYKDIQNRIPPNQEFSNFIHRLRSCGYKEYVFSLARHLAYDVEFMRTSVKDIVYVYKFVGKHTFGVLTVFHDDEHKWYVKVSRTSLMRLSKKIIDIEYPTMFY